MHPKIREYWENRYSHLITTIDYRYYRQCTIYSYEDKVIFTVAETYYHRNIFNFVHKHLNFKENDWIYYFNRLVYNEKEMLRLLKLKVFT